MQSSNRRRLLVLTSAQNPKVKELHKLLDDGRFRKEKGQFVLEGAREINRALARGFKPVACFGLEGEATGEKREALKALEAYGAKNPELAFFQISPQIMEKLAVRNSADNLLATFEVKPLDSAKEICQKAFEATKNPHFLALSGVEKPGNLGAIVRSADASGVQGIFIVKGSSQTNFDLYHPKLMRNSLGAVFSQRFAVLTAQELKNICIEKHIRLIGAALTPSAQDLYESDLQRPLVFVVGSEASGIEPELLKDCDETLKIPMEGICDSLNVSVATAILLFEARRQKRLGHFKSP